MTPVLLGALFIALCVWVVATSDTFQNCIGAVPDQGSGQNLKDCIARFLAFFSRQKACAGDFVHENGEAIIAAFTVILALSTIALWAATRSLVRGAEKTAERQLRAYMAFDKGTVVVNDDGIFIEIKFRNTGQTPAYDVYTVADVGTFQKDAKLPDLVQITKPPDLRAIGPRQRMPFVKILKPTAEEMKSIEALSLRAYIWGRLNYIDAFGVPRYLDFKCRVGRHAAGFWALQPTEGGEKAN